MKNFKFTLISAAVLSMAACSTVPEKALFAGIDSSKITPVAESAEGSDGANGKSYGSASLFGGLSGGGVQSAESQLAETQIKASASNPTCAQFNVNALAFSAKPETPGFGTGLMKTIALGTLAGFTSGGVASLGIGSAFLEATAIGTANQVVFSGARPVVDKVIPDGTVAPSDKQVSIKEAADRLGCPNPTWATSLSPAEAAALSSKLAKETKAAKKLLKKAG